MHLLEIYKDDINRKIELIENAHKKGHTVPIVFSNDQKAVNNRDYDIYVFMHQ